MPASRRFQLLEQRAVNRETFVEPWPEAGLIVADSPDDPQPSLRVEAGRVIELDGRPRIEFDILDYFIADHGLDLASAGMSKQGTAPLPLLAANTRVVKTFSAN